MANGDSIHYITETIDKKHTTTAEGVWRGVTGVTGGAIRPSPPASSKGDLGLTFKPSPLNCYKKIKI